MTVDPREYSLDDLRPDPPTVPGNGGHTADNVVRRAQYRELLEREAMADAVERPYLTAIPDAFSGEVIVFDWLEYLYRKAGFRGTVRALGFYRSIGWISSDLHDRLEAYLQGFEGAEPGEGASLDRADHLLSLIYIARLAAMG